MAIEFGLQGQARPVGKGRISAAQHGLVEKRDHSEDYLLHIFRVAATASSFLLSHSQRLFHLCAK